jgi:hypothetical protein
MVTFNAHEQDLQHSVPDAGCKSFFAGRGAWWHRHPTRLATSTLRPGPMVELIAARFR